MRGQVYKSTGSWYKVKDENGEFWNCRTKGKLRLAGIKSTNPVAVGDFIEFEEDENSPEQEGIIKEIYDRKNYLLRKSTNLSKQTHVIAANVDLLFLVITIDNPPTSYGFIDRFLVMAEAFNVPVHILINKWDLYENETLEKAQEYENLYKSIGYPVTRLSVENGLGFDTLKELIKDQCIVFSGHSGVGKSSILKLLAPDLEIRIGDTSTVHQKGKHTTTFAEMFDLDHQAKIIDTPGIKGYGITRLEKDEIALYFKEMKALLDECKFYNCKHLNEPNCAVKEAVVDGEIPESRYYSYLNMMEDDEGTFRSNKYH